MPGSTLAAHKLDPETFPRRLFVGWDRTVLRTTAAQLAEHYASPGELRMEAATVVLPGARAARRLKEHLLEEAEQRGLRLVPPRITTVGTLPELLYAPPHPHATDALQRRIWTHALRQLPPERLGLLYAEPPASGDLLGWSRLARTLAALHREVSGAGLRFEEVARLTEKGLLFADTERWSVLAELQSAYATELARLGFSDPGLARIEALASGALSLESDLWLVGVIEMPRVLARMLAALPDLAHRLTVVVQAPEEEAERFDALGCLRPEAWTARPIPLEDSHLTVQEGPAEQAAEVTRFLASLGGAYAAEEVLVAVPDETLVPYLEQSLEQAGVTTHAAAGTPIDRSPVLRLLAGVADFLDGRRFDAGAALLRHPDLGRRLRQLGRDAESQSALARVDGWLAALDTYFSEHLPARLLPPPPSRTSEEARLVAELLGALEHDTLLGRFRGHRPLGEWMPEIVGFLVEVYGRRELDASRPADRRVMETGQRLKAAALDLMSLPAQLHEPCDAPTAIRLLLDELSDLSLSPDPDREAVELLGWLELRLDDAPVAVITGFNEPFLPESLNAHPFLPNSLRERLGLVGNARRYARDAYELTALVHSRERLHVISGRRSSTGDPLRPSRLAFAAEGETLARRVEQFYAPREASEQGTQGTEYPAAPSEAAFAPPELAAPPPAPGGFALPPEPIIHAPAPITRLRVTDFRLLLADPYYFALQRILRLEPLDDSARELDGLRFGSLAHEVLERFARSEAVHLTDAVAIRRQLDAILDAIAQSWFGDHALPAVRLQIEQLRARLHAFAAWHADWIADGWRVMDVECSTPAEGVPFDVDGEPIGLTGRIDRIDYHRERRIWALFDYKTGDRGDGPEETHRPWKREPRAWADLQLPLYRHLLPHLPAATAHGIAGAAPEGELRLGYILLPRELDRTGACFAPWTPEELEEADECARDLVRFIRRNEFAFDPAARKAYQRSPLAAVVGIGALESAEGAQGGQEGQGTEDELEGGA